MLFYSLCCVLLFSSFVAAQDNRPVDPNNHWVSIPSLPGPQYSVNAAVYQNNTVWTNNQYHPLSWVANFTVRVVCYQEGPNTTHWIPIYNGTNNNVYANVSIPDEWLDGGNVFWFGVYNQTGGGNSPDFFSHYFNITRDTATTSAGGTTQTTRPPLITSTTNPGPSPNAVAIGAGVGGGLGGAIILVALGFCFFCIRKRSRKNKVNNNNDDDNDDNNNHGPAVVSHEPAGVPIEHYNEKEGGYPDNMGHYGQSSYAGSQYTPTYYGSPPLGSPEPAPNYKPPYEMSHAEREQLHEMDPTSARP